MNIKEKDIKRNNVIQGGKKERKGKLSKTRYRRKKRVRKKEPTNKEKRKGKKTLKERIIKWKW